MGNIENTNQTSLFSNFSEWQGTHLPNVYQNLSTELYGELRNI